MGIESGIFKRVELLLGNVVMQKIAEKKVIILGTGGVGSWCAESLVRSGIEKLTIVDSDRVCVTNINRQLMATTKTVGQVKVDVLKERLLEINPKAKITALQKIYDAETAASFQLDNYDYIIDAIDSLASKVHLIQTATKTNAVFFSSMGAALKMDATKIRVAEFWKVQGCPLARALRSRLKKTGLPSKKFICVYSEELLQNKGENSSCGIKPDLCPQNVVNDDGVIHNWCSTKAQTNGTLVHVVAVFGFMLAGLVIEDIMKNMEP